MRVGRFTVKNVPCAILPGGAKVDPLLGGSFLQFFTYKYTPATDKLVLTEIQTEENSPTPPRTKSSAKRKQRKSPARPETPVLKSSDE